MHPVQLGKRPKAKFRLACMRRGRCSITALVAAFCAVTALGSYAAPMTLRLPMSAILEPVPPDIANNWWINGSATSAAEALAQGIEEPSPIDDAGWPTNPKVGISATELLAVAEVQVDPTQLAGRRIVKGTAWFYATTGPSSTLRIELICSGCSNTTFTSLGPNTPFGWYSVSFVPPKDQAEGLPDSLHLKFTASSIGALTGTTIRGAYVNLQLFPAEYLVPPADFDTGPSLSDPK